MLNVKLQVDATHVYIILSAAKNKVLSVINVTMNHYPEVVLTSYSLFVYPFVACSDFFLFVIACSAFLGLHDVPPLEICL